MATQRKTKRVTRQRPRPRESQILPALDVQGVYAQLGQRLISATTHDKAATIILGAANELFSWDACTLDFYSADENKMYSVLNINRMRQASDAPSAVPRGAAPTAEQLQILRHGARLSVNGRTSTMAVPIREKNEAIGILTVKRTNPELYTRGQLKTLQALADYCTGTFERIRAEEELARHKRELTDLIENAAIGIHWENAQGQIIWANHTELELLGYPLEEYVSRPFSDFCADPNTTVDFSGLLHKPAPVTNLETRLRAADGSLKYVSISANPVFHDDEFIHIRVFTRDITERKAAEVEAEQRAQRGLLLAKISHSLAEAGRDFHAVLQVIGQEVAESFGDACVIRLISEDEKLLMPVAIYHRDAEAMQLLRQTLTQTPQRVDEGIGAEVLRSGQSVLRSSLKTEELRASLNPGFHPYLDRFAPHSLLAAPLTAQGRTIGVLYVGRDISAAPLTVDDRSFLEEIAHRASLVISNALYFEQLQQELAERKRTEEALQKSREIYRNLVENIRELFFVIDPRGKVIYGSPNFFSETGFTPAEIIGKSYVRLIHPDDRARIIEFYKKKTKDGTVDTTIEFRGRRRDGSSTWVEQSTRILRDEQNNVVEYRNLVRDITQRKSALEAVERFARQREWLLEISQTVLSTLSLEELLQLILKSLQEAAPYDSCALFLYDKESEILRPYLSVGTEWLAKDFRSWSMPITKGIAGSVATSGKAERVNNSNRDPRSEYPPGAFPKHEHLISFPLITKGETFGVINIGRTSDPPFSDDEFRLAQLFVGYAASAIENAQLFEQIKVSERKYRSIFDYAPVGIYQSEPDGSLITGNRTLAEFLDFPSVDELSGVNLHELFVSQDEFTSMIRHHESMRETFSREILLKKNTGTTRWVHLTQNAVRDSGGIIVRLEGFVTDIQKRKEAEEKLRKSEELYRNLVENISEGYYVSDRKGRLVYASPNIFGASGYSPRELLYQSYTRLIAREDRRQIVDLYLARTNDGTQDVRCEFRVRRKGGTTFWVEQSTRILRNSKGEVTEYRSIVRDITERKRMEEQKIRAEAANRAKSQFLATMSHELRTPLNSIIGFTNVLLKNNNNRLKPDEIVYLERVLENGLHLLTLINDLLDLSRIESGQHQVQLAPVLVDKLVWDTIAQMEGRTVGRDVKLLVEIDHPVGPFPADPGKLKQVLINLISNALKFTEQGSVRVLVEVDPGSSLPKKIHIIDTGIGIPSDRQHELFTAFQQIDDGLNRKYEGSGLGLSISKSLCDLMGYSLTFTSDLGKGSTFIIDLNPLESAATSP
jgi:PAS domain S-box-containing protein